MRKRYLLSVVVARCSWAGCSVSFNFIVIGKEAMKTVLLIDSDREFRESFRDALERYEVDVIDVDCPTSAYEQLHLMDPPDLIVGDLFMPFTTGSDSAEYKTSYEVGVRTLQELAWVFPDKPVIALASLEGEELARVKGFLGASPAHRKPDEMRGVTEIVCGYLSSAEYGGVQ
jgi:CheY-like chemotaxis protein